MTENTASRGAAIYSNSTMSVTGSAFEKNVAQNEGGALYAVAGSDVTVEQSAFTQNEAPTGGGAIYVAADAIVTSEKSVFTENTAGTGGNGGAVHTKGTYNDIRGTYVDNSAKNGGAIAILKDSNATNAGIANFINETTQYTLQHQGAFFSGNKATGTNNSRGAAIFVNSGASSVSVSGYPFEDNSVGLGEVYVVSGGSAAIADTTFTEKETAIVYVAGTLTFENITEVTLKQENNGTLLVAGYEEENDIAIIPGSYIGNRVVLEKADGVADDVFVAACDNIVLEQENTGDSAGEDDQWYISSEGTLQRGVASIGDVKYGSLAEAVDYANTIGGTGEAEDIVIILFNDETLTEKIAINKNIKIINKEGKNVTILRDVNLADDMFVINDGAKLTLGTSDENEEGKLIVDGTSESRIAYRSIENKSGAIFVLEKNASLENANSSLKGAALYNSGTAYVYGTILSNATTNNGSGIYAVSGAQTTMQNAIFAENYAKGGGAAIFIEAGATVTGTNCIFDANEGSTTDGNGGAVHVKGTYTDTNSTYTNNTGKNGGAIAVLSGGSASIIGTDANAIFSGNEAAAKGSAVFVNSGNCSVNVEGYTFTNNTTGTGAVYVVNGGTGVLTDVTFKGANAQIVNVDGTLTFDNVTGTTFVQGQNGKLYVAGYDINNQLSVTPYQYVADHVVFLKADGAVSSVFEAACENITLTPDANDNPWYVNAEGKLTIIAAYIGEMSFGSLAEAVVYANTNGGTGEVADIVITLLNDTILTEKIEITKNIQIVNKVGEEITISRSTDFTTDDMFLVSAGKLTLGTNEASETGKLIVDGATTSAIGFHSVVNASGANFVLAKNASLENANATVAGAAINNSGTAYVYGTIQNNDTSNAGAGIYVNANAIAYTENAVFKGNYAKGGGAAIYVLADGTVTSLNCIFEENEGSSASGNGGAVHAKGNYYDTNSEYKNNIGRNGGAIAVMGTGEVIITGTNEHAIFSGNTAHANGSAIFANSGGCAITVNGYTFTNNTTGTGAVFIQKGGSATFTDITFSGDTAQNVNVNGTLTFDNVTGTTFVQGQNGVLKVAGYVTENELSVTPYQYTEGQVVLLKADETADEVFALASKKIMLVSDGSENTWYMEDGALKIAVARIGDTYYDAWTTAIAYANTVGGTGNAEDVVIYVLTNVALSEKVEITKNIAIVNEAGKEITISRAADFTTADMFLVNADAKLTLGTNDATETGKLIIDGATASRVAYRIVENPSGATFVLAKNATLMNADSSVKGAGLYNNGTAFIYGTIHNNKSSSDGGGINVNAGSVTINGAFFTENYAATTGGLFIAAGASVTCENATFEGNTSPGNGGAVHAKGNYSDTNSKYIN